MQENNTNSLSALLTQIKQQSATVEFEQVMQVIKDSYNYQHNKKQSHNR